MRGSRTSLAPLLGILVVLLSGCLKLDADLAVAPDDTVTGRYVVAYRKDPAKPSTGFAPVRPLLVSKGSADTRKYDDGQYEGAEYRLTGVPFADLAAFRAVSVQGRQTGTLQLTRDGDDVLVAGTFDFREPASVSRTAQQRAESERLFSVRVRLTFAGDVRSANAPVQGRTVTWDMQPFVRTTLQARAAAVPPAPPPRPAAQGSWAVRITLLVVLALALLLLARIVQVRRRRSRPRPVPAGAAADPADFSWVLGRPPPPRPVRPPED